VIGALAQRELTALYATPLGWLALAVSQLILAWLFFAQLEVYQELETELVASGTSLGAADLIVAPTLNTAGLLLLLIAPLFGMQGFAAERRNGSLALLLASPVGPLTLVLGKFLGQWLALWPLVVLALLTTASLGLAIPLDFGRLASSALGLLALSGLAAAVALWLSSLSVQPAAAAAATYGVFLLLWLLDAGGRETAWQWFALTPHLGAPLQGLARLTDLLYFVGLCLAALALATHRLWRLGGGR
jgi:ABC-2 type transport system permease protein